MIALALLVILAQPAHGRRAVRQDVTFAEGITRSRFDLSGTPDTRPDAPLFSFAVPAPGYKGYAASYAGLPAADGCYDPSLVTGTKGEALTFTRATTRFCPTSANEATGVMCASGEVCITSSGTTRGISVFRAGTNKALRSQEFDNAAWGKAAGGGPAVPTVTADAAVAPNGTTTAERVQVDSCATAGRYSHVFQDVGAGAAAHSYSIWLRGNASTPTVSLCVYYGGTNTCTQKVLTTEWRRYSVENHAHGAANNILVLGCNNETSTYAGATNSGAADFFAWGAQVEQSPYPTPYVATTSASATRNAETATFPISWSGSAWSAASTLVQRKATTGFGIVALHSSFPAGGPNALSYVTGGGLMSMYSAGAEHATFDPSSYYSTSDRTVSYCTGSASGNIWAGHETIDVSCGSFSTGNTTLAVGWFTANTQNDAINSDVCIDPSPTRCR